jgi:signal transduction histidine kinase/streptogramin lyase
MPPSSRSGRPQAAARRRGVDGRSRDSLGTSSAVAAVESVHASRVPPLERSPARRRAGALPLCAAVALLLVMLLGMWTPAVHAAPGAPPQAVLSTLSHTAWTRRQGAPANIYQIAQDADGWLWLGTQDGLYRFDGMRFEHVDGVSAGILSLFATPDGDLWIGAEDGRVLCRHRHGTDVYDKVGGGPPGPPVGFALAPEGGVLAAFNHGLFRFDKGRWERLPMPGHEHDLYALTVDARGAVWLLDGGDILLRRKGEAAFRVVSRTYPRRFLAPLRDGGVLSSELEGAPLVLRQDAAAAAARPLPPEGLLTGTISLDREGRLWVSAFPDGIELYDREKVDAFLARGAPLTAPEHMSVAQGLSGKHPWSIFQDREGNVWLGTNAGLDRFRPTKLTPVALDEAGQAALAAADGGGAWVGRWNLPWARVDARGATLAPEGDGKPYAHLNCAYRGRSGAVWLCANHGLFRIAGGRRQAIPYPPEMGRDPTDDNGGYVQALTEDRDGDLWLAGNADHWMRWHAGRWTAEPWPDGLPRRDGLVAAESLADGTLCAAREDRLACRSPGGRWRDCAPAGADVGRIQSLQAYGDRLWIGGSDGLAWMEHCEVHALGTKGQRGPMRNVSGIVQTPDGELWFNGADGVGRIARPELAALMAGGSALGAAIELLDQDDGLDGVPEQVRPVPTAIRAVDGTLWFSTSAGTYWIDPAHVRRNEVPPVLAIERLVADDRAYAVGGPRLALPPDPQRLTVDYTALSLSSPQRVRFQYRLDGIDARWNEAGTRREAVYTRLPPGHYRFRVRAVNEDGVSSRDEATQDFEVPPAFTESGWFRAACALLALLAVMAAVRWRVSLSMARLRERLGERLLERERIARELHDTLLQSMTALVLKLDAAVRQLPRSEAARGGLEQLLQQTEQAVVEARDRIVALRAVGEDGAGLMEALEDAGRRLASEQDGAAAHLETRVAGDARVLQAVAGQEALWIGREALANAFRHARASRIVVSIDYRPEHFVMRVDDDGQGIAPAILEAGGRPGHWGLRGMRERADEIGGRLVVGPSPLGGTAVELTVPAAILYRELAEDRPPVRALGLFARALGALRFAR